MKKSYITTTLGVIIIIGSVISVFLNKADWTGASIGIGSGIGFIFTKDHNV